MTENGLEIGPGAHLHDAVILPRVAVIPHRVVAGETLLQENPLIEWLSRLGIWVMFNVCLLANGEVDTILWIIEGLSVCGRSPPFMGGRRRPTPPRSGLTMFVAGFNFITNERVRPFVA